MDFSIFSILMLDGVTNGAVYALLGLATVLVFAVTRVIFIPQGEFVAYGALTLAIFQTGKVPGTVWLLLILAVLAALLELVGTWRHTGNPAKAVKEIKGGRIEFKMDKQANVNAAIGKLSSKNLFNIAGHCKTEKSLCCMGHSICCREIYR